MAQQSRIEQTILSSLFFKEEYTRKVLPFIKEEYFGNRVEQLLYGEIFKFITKYNNLPTKDSILIELGQRRDINEEELDHIKDYVSKIEDTESDEQWLTETTEKFCKDRAVHNAVLSGIKILDKKDKTRTPESIPHILSEALAVSFDKSVGHDYIQDADERFKFYHTKEKRYQFDLDYMNRITKGGVPSKTLNIALAGTGVGKSLFMCHVASSYLLQGLNVLYITLEMAEERIAERIDANLLDVTMEDLHDMPQQLYEGKITKLREKSQGQLIIK